MCQINTAPVLRLRNVTQTTLTLEWDPLQLANADLHSLDIVRNGQRIAKVPRPLNTTSTKLSGLSMDTDYTIQLVLYTSAGTFVSDELQARTHTIADTSGIHVCLGSFNDPRLLEATKQVIESLGAKWSDHIQIDTTHLVATGEPSGVSHESNEFKSYTKAHQLSIPIVQPHWLFACADEKRYVYSAHPVWSTFLHFIWTQFHQMQFSSTRALQRSRLLRIMQQPRQRVLNQRQTRVTRLRSRMAAAVIQHYLLLKKRLSKKIKR